MSTSFDNQPQGAGSAPPAGAPVPSQTWIKSGPASAPGAPGYYPPPNSGYDPNVAGYPASSQLPGLTRGWAISALVLGSICLLMYGLSTLGLFALASISNKGVPPAATLVAVDALAAIFFIVGGAGVLQRREWGRKLLMGVSACACVLLALDLGFTFTIGSQSSPMLMDHSAQAFQSGFQTGLHFGALFGDLGKACYCILLLLHLNSTRVKELMSA